MPNLTPPSTGDILRSHQRDVDRFTGNAWPSRRTSKALTRIGENTLIRMAEVQADGIVQGEKVREIDRLTEKAMSGQAMLARWRQVLAGQDIELYDELRFFSDVARMGKGEVLASTIDCFNRSC